MAIQHERGQKILRWVLLGSLLTTGLHYAHNTIRAQDYPPVEGLILLATRILVGGGWFVFATFAVLAFLAYGRRRYWAANAYLLVFSLSGLASLGHFFFGVPDIPAFWFATIFTDVLSSLAVWAFVTWVAIGIRTEQAARAEALSA
ncbi:hypothetical protein [Amycolatopsis sp. YIM 10]|uniref:hypothetical protein n=1 Tax=Amycolatopsis sp. YIM 10 TaxID=2653857 RepID=UPI00128FDCCB|nr:hypothetical protein [Amycolatopsis sp. YIM 10]QFU85845.1 hypothetical protein YIM_03115 [Amycolatopsis sp. YIM 10]